jgi:hypothetical protein
MALCSLRYIKKRPHYHPLPKPLMRRRAKDQQVDNDLLGILATRNPRQHLVYSMFKVCIRVFLENLYNNSIFFFVEVIFDLKT